MEKIFIDSDRIPLERGLYEIVPQVKPLLFTGDFVELGAVFLDYQGAKYIFTREKLLGVANRLTDSAARNYTLSLRSEASWVEGILSSQSQPK